MDVIRPPRLQPGDAIGLIAPSDCLLPYREQIGTGMARLASLGFRLRTGQYIWNEHGRHAGTVAERLADLHAMWADPEVKGIIAIMGGSGCMALVDKVDFGLVQANPKVFVGFSDLSILLNALHARAGLVTFMGPDVANDLANDTEGRGTAHFLQVTGRPEPAGLLPAWTGPVGVLRSGTGTRVAGPLLAQNIPCSTHLLGTPYFPDAAGSIFCVESFRVSAVQLMRALVQLRLAGVLGKVSALVIGQMEGCFTDFEDPNEGLRWAVEIGVGDLPIPVYTTAGFGHGVISVTLPVGCRASVGTDGFRLEEPAVR